jgi:hypothetical protein
MSARVLRTDRRAVRAPRARRERIVLSLSKGAILALVTLSLGVGVASFSAGYWTGQPPGAPVATFGPGPDEFASGARSEPKASEVGWSGFAGPGPDEFASGARTEPKASEVGWSGFAGPGPDGRVAPGPREVAPDPPQIAPAPPVEVEAAKAVEPPALDVRDRAPSGAFGVQIGAFPAREEALAFLERHRTALRGQPVFLLATEIQGRGTWYRVRVGAVTGRADAEALRGGLPAALSAASMVTRHP